MPSRRQVLVRNLYIAAGCGVVAAAISTKWSMWVAISFLIGTIVCLTATVYVQYTREIWPDENIAATLAKMRLSDDDLEIQEAAADAVYVRLLLKVRPKRSADAASSKASYSEEIADDIDNSMLMKQMLHALVKFPQSVTLAKNVHALFACLITADKQYRPHNAEIPKKLFGEMVSSLARHGNIDAEVASKAIMAIGAIIESPFEDDAMPNNADVQYAVTTITNVWRHYLRTDNKDVITWCMWATVHFCYRELTQQSTDAVSCATLLGADVVDLIRQALLDLAGDRHAVQLAVSICHILIRVDPKALRSMMPDSFLATMKSIARQYEGEEQIRLQAAAIVQAIEAVRHTR